MKDFRTDVKRTIGTLVAMAMLATSLPIPLWAEESIVFDHEHIAKEKVKYINIPPLYQPAAFEEDPTSPEAADKQLADPPMPKTYTYEMDYLVPRNRQNLPAYQPYIATVGDEGMVTSEEKAKISQTIPSPQLVGYTVKPKKTDISYDFVKNEAKKGKEVVKGQSWENIVPYMYQPSQNYVKVKHTFQELYKPEKFGPREKGSKPIWTYLRGQVGYDQPLQPCDNVEDRAGFEPEPNLLKVCIPDVAASDDTGVELRYFRKRHDLIFNTDGGTPIPSRKLIYGQTIPYIEKEPTKEGATFLGWQPNIDLHYVKNDGSKGILKKEKTFRFSEADFKENGIKEAMPDSSVILTAKWNENKIAKYTIQFWAQKAESDGYEFVDAKIVEGASTEWRPPMKITYSVNRGNRYGSATPPPCGIEGMYPVGVKFPGIDKPLDEDFIRVNLTTYYTLNVEKTIEENKELVPHDDGTMGKEFKRVQSNNNTVYNIYYDRTVYTLLFEKGLDT